MQTTVNPHAGKTAQAVSEVLNSHSGSSAPPKPVLLRVFDETSTAGEDGASQSKERSTPKDLEAIALVVGREAAGLVRRRRGELADDHGHIGVLATKTSEVDPVTEVDEASERLISQRLLEHVPGSRILGEEGGFSGVSDELSSSDEVLWIVDPIDGTVNFLYGVPAYAVSIAAVINGEPVAAVVVDVAAHVAYAAHAGGDARRLSYDDHGRLAQIETLRVVPEDSDEALHKALVATGFSYVAEDRRSQAERLVRLLPKVRDIRRIGSAALDLCRVASGEVDAYFEHGLGPWDHAAGCLIAARAGAISVAPDYDVMKEEKALVMTAKPGIAVELARLLGE